MQPAVGRLSRWRGDWVLKICHLPFVNGQRPTTTACNEKAAWSLVSRGACVRVRNGSSLPAIDSAMQGRTWHPRGVKRFVPTKLPKLDLTTDAEYVANYGRPIE